jgi:hypothetical protein
VDDSQGLAARSQRVDEVTEPPHVLELEVRRVVQVDVRLRDPVDAEVVATRALAVGREDGGQSDPFVDGTPATLGSSATASHRALATALNCASATWWAFRPARTRTCRQTCADAANDSQMWRVRVVS